MRRDERSPLPRGRRRRVSPEAYLAVHSTNDCGLTTIEVEDKVVSHHAKAGSHWDKVRLRSRGLRN
eukprot:IDg12496t1